MKVYLPTAAFVVLALTGLSSAAQSKRNEGCGDYDSEKTHARWTYIVARADADRFHTRLREWGAAHGLRVGVVTSDRSITTFLHAPAERAIIDIQTSGGDDRANIRIFSNCWPPRDDWRRYKQPLRYQLEQWGYRQSS